MTDLLYMEDSYLRGFEAKIVQLSEDGLRVYLDRTAFYPGGGGQPFDIGIIKYKNQDYPVVKMGKDENKEIYHELAKPIHAKKEEKIVGTIDWDRRYKLMRTHTALHILCGLIWKEFNASVTGGNMEIDKARMDFNLEDFSKERVDYIQKRVNEEIDAGHEIKTRILSREEAFKIPDLIRTKINLLPAEIKEVRVVEIVDLDIQADGGTHLKSTKEVGKVVIVETINKGKENKRMIIKIE
ncbi:MAG: alanyl-tRNA editing protein [Candidatus Thorarchaeota archaeon]